MFVPPAEGPGDLGRARDLFLRCAERDGAAWETFLARYRPLLAFLARRLMSVAGAASAQEEYVDEAVQETLALLLRDGGARLRRYDGVSRPSTWLRLCVLTVVYDRLRRQRREPDRVPLEVLGTAVYPGADPVDAAHASDQAARVVDALHGLPARHEIAMRLFYLEGSSARDVSLILGTTESAVVRLLAKAREGVRRILGAKPRGVSGT